MEELLHPQKDSAQRFLWRWYGISKEQPTETATPCRDVPSELIDWHNAAASTGTRVTFQDYPVKPSELTRASDGMMVFWIENQHGYYWAVDPESPDHQVFDRTNTSDTWRPSGDTLEEFLLNRTVREALLGAEAKFSAVAEDESFTFTLSKFSPLPFRPAVNESPSTRWLCADNAIARISPAPAGYGPAGQKNCMLTIAARPDANLQAYRTGLESIILPKPPPREALRLALEEPPF